MIKRSVATLVALMAALFVPATVARLNSQNAKDFVEFQTFELDGEVEDIMWCG